MEFLKLALETITGSKISNYAFMHPNFLDLAQNLSDQSKPFHFNEVLMDKNIDKIKEGFFLVFNKDLINFNGFYYEGVNRIYSKRDILNILQNEQTVLVR